MYCQRSMCWNTKSSKIHLWAQKRKSSHGTVTISEILPHLSQTCTDLIFAIQISHSVHVTGISLGSPTSQFSLQVLQVLQALNLHQTSNKAGYLSISNSLNSLNTSFYIYILSIHSLNQGLLIPLNVT